MMNRNREASHLDVVVEEGGDKGEIGENTIQFALPVSTLSARGEMPSNTTATSTVAGRAEISTFNNNATVNEEQDVRTLYESQRYLSNVLSAANETLEYHQHGQSFAQNERRDTIGPDDVLLGRGAPIINNVGNVRFRNVVAAYKAQYMASSRHQWKTQVALMVIHEITQNRNGRFLKRIEDLSDCQINLEETVAVTWTNASDAETLRKVKQALRENDNQSRTIDYNTTVAFGTDTAAKEDETFPNTVSESTTYLKRSASASQTLPRLRSTTYLKRSASASQTLPRLRSNTYRAIEESDGIGVKTNTNRKKRPATKSFIEEKAMGLSSSRIRMPYSNNSDIVFSNTIEMKQDSFNMPTLFSDQPQLNPHQSQFRFDESIMQPQHVQQKQTLTGQEQSSRLSSATTSLTQDHLSLQLPPPLMTNNNAPYYVKSISTVSALLEGNRTTPSTVQTPPQHWNNSTGAIESFSSTNYVTGGYRNNSSNNPNNNITISADSLPTAEEIIELLEKDTDF